MTSASELFYNRRSRFGRNSQDLGLDSLPPERSFHHSPTHARRGHHFSGSGGGGGGNHRHDLDGCDPLRRHPQARNGYNRASHQDRAVFRVEESASQYGSSFSNRADAENLISTSRPAIAANDRLPGAVLLARARLCERLRGLPLSGSRSRGRVTSNTSGGELWLDDDSRPFDASDWEIANFTSWSISGSRSDSQTVRQQLLRLQNKKPSGLTQEALDCLQLELFTDEETGPEQKEPTVSMPQDCSICLESYVLGDQLVRLPCEHRFHASCLDPWVRICGDCPCCRRAITVKKIATKVL